MSRAKTAVPLKMIGHMVLDRWSNNIFAETEQVAYCPANVVPGIDFSNEPLLQGCLFSCLDTRLSSQGSPNSNDKNAFIAAVKTRQWDREKSVRTLA